MARIEEPRQERGRWLLQLDKPQAVEAGGSISLGGEGLGKELLSDLRWLSDTEHDVRVGIRR